MKPHSQTLSRRERQLMDALYTAGNATAAEIQARLSDDPGYDSVRVTLRNLEKKGFVTHHKDGPRNVYRPTIPHDEATRTALSHMLKTFFRGSQSGAILALLELPEGGLSREELDLLAERVERARKEEGEADD